MRYFPSNKVLPGILMTIWKLPDVFRPFSHFPDSPSFPDSGHAVAWVLHDFCRIKSSVYWHNTWTALHHYLPVELCTQTV